MKKIDAFVLFSDPEQMSKTIKELQCSEYVNKIYLLKPENIKGSIKGCKSIEIDIFESSNTIKK